MSRSGPASPAEATEAKRGLVRVVRTPEGRVELDATGKKNGRGAYVHDARACWDEALKRGPAGPRAEG